MSQIDEREYEKVKNRMKLAAKISDTLKEENLSQKEFAKMLGKKPSEVSKWLSGTHNFTHDTLIDIQSVLNIELINNHIESKHFTSIKNIEIHPSHASFTSYSLKESNIAYKSSIKSLSNHSRFN